MGSARVDINQIAQKRNQLPVEIEPASTALVVVDMQRYYCQADSPFCRFLESRDAGRTEYLLGRVESTVVPNLKKLVGAFRERGMKVIWTALASLYPNGSDLSLRLRQLNESAVEANLPFAIPWIQDDWAGIIPQLQPAEGEPILQKSTFGSFASTDLYRHLVQDGIRKLVIGGVVTNMCVETTAREAVDRSLEVVVVEDGCSAFFPDTHDASLLGIQVSFGKVRSTTELLALISSEERQPPN